MLSFLFDVIATGYLDFTKVLHLERDNKTEKKNRHYNYASSRRAHEKAGL